MNQIADITCHSFSKDDRLFLDANVWLFVYGPIAYPLRKAGVYSRALRDMQLANCTIFIDVLVLSEFINRFARLEYNQSSSGHLDFKSFRKSTAFKPVAKDIVNNARRIVKQSQEYDPSFTSLDIEALLTEFEKGDSDFNDQVFAKICKEKQLILVTDDADFGATGVTILTANNRLLSP